MASEKRQQDVEIGAANHIIGSTKFHALFAIALHSIHSMKEYQFE